MPNVDLTHRSAIEYNRYVADKLVGIFTPLFTNSLISTFGYRKFFPNGSYLALCTRNDWQEYYFHNVSDPGIAFGNAISAVQLNKFTYFLWPNDHNDDTLLKALWDFDIWNGVTVYYKTTEYVESFAFTGKKDDMQLHNFFINNVKLIEKYIEHFKEAAKEFIKPDKNNLAKFKNIMDMNLQPKSERIEKNLELKILDNNANLLLDKQGQLIRLSKREEACLDLLSKGQTCKSIARALNISARTVETYINSIKFKTNTNCKLELLSLYYTNGDLNKNLDK